MSENVFPSIMIPLDSLPAGI